MSRSIKKGKLHHFNRHGYVYRNLEQPDRFAKWLGCSEKADLIHVYIKKKITSERSIVHYRNPNWWNHLYSTKKIRSINNGILRRLPYLKDLEEHPVFVDRVHTPYFF